MIAVVEAYRAGVLARQYWMRNLVAGVIVGATFNYVTSSIFIWHQRT